MNSRRSIGFPRAESYAGQAKNITSYVANYAYGTPKRPAANVRFGSKADIGATFVYVRFTPKSGH
jgi:hypothetical protein